MNYSQAVQRRNDGKRNTVHRIEQNIVADKQVDMVNINSFSSVAHIQ